MWAIRVEAWVLRDQPGGLLCLYIQRITDLLNTTNKIIQVLNQYTSNRSLDKLINDSSTVLTASAIINSRYAKQTCKGF